MKTISKRKDDWGEWVIYVQKCDQYEYEDPDVPKNAISSLHNQEDERIYDIIYAVENYFEE